MSIFVLVHGRICSDLNKTSGQLKFAFNFTQFMWAVLRLFTTAGRRLVLRRVEAWRGGSGTRQLVGSI